MVERAAGAGHTMLVYHEKPPPRALEEETVSPSASESLVTAWESLPSKSSSSSSGSPPLAYSPAYSPTHFGGPEVEEIPCLNHLYLSSKEAELAVPSPSVVEHGAPRRERLFTLQTILNVQGIRKQPGRIWQHCSPSQDFPLRIAFDDVYLSAQSGHHRLLVVKGFSKPDLDLLSKIYDENVVNVYGCCLFPRRRPLLVYDCFSNESPLPPLDKASMRRPTHRVKVAADIASALAYLHSTSSLPVIHRDVRSPVILLHVEDGTDPIFRLLMRESRELHVNLRIFGTTCFMDPDYHLSGKSTCMSDVFSFGAILLELLTGENTGVEDPSELVHRKNYIPTPSSCMDKLLADMAFKCLSNKAEERPAMVDLAMELAQFIDDHLSGTRIAGSQNAKSSARSISACQYNSPSFHGNKNTALDFETKHRDYMRGIGRSVLANAFSLGINGRLRKKRVNKLVKVNEEFNSCVFNHRISARNKETILQYWTSCLSEDSNLGFRIISLKEIQEATSWFHESHILSKGKSTIYKGKLSWQDTFVAVKVPSTVSTVKSINEISILLQLKNHNNVVKLLGCCWESEALITVYEFTENGPLNRHIHQLYLPFQRRLRIAVEVAEALSYMHSSSPCPVVHGNVELSNILVDRHFSAKLSGFGNSMFVKVMHMNEQLVEPPYHVDPEFASTGQLTSQNDVYSFAVLLAQLLTGKEAFWAEEKKADRSLASQFISFTKKYRLDEICEEKADEMSFMDQLKAESLINIVTQCLSLKREERPTMKELVIRLTWLHQNNFEPPVTCVIQ